MGIVVSIKTGQEVKPQFTDRELIKKKWKSGDYEKGRFNFWLVFDLPSGKRTLSSVELMSIID